MFPSSIFSYFHRLVLLSSFSLHSPATSIPAFLATDSPELQDCLFQFCLGIFKDSSIKHVPSQTRFPSLLWCSLFPFLVSGVTICLCSLGGENLRICLDTWTQSPAVSTSYISFEWIPSSPLSSGSKQHPPISFSDSHLSSSNLSSVFPSYWSMYNMTFLCL